MAKRILIFFKSAKPPCPLPPKEDWLNSDKCTSFTLLRPGPVTYPVSIGLFDSVLLFLIKDDKFGINP